MRKFIFFVVLTFVLVEVDCSIIEALDYKSVGCHSSLFNFFFGVYAP